MAGRFTGLLLEDKRPLSAKLRTAHMLRQEKFWNAKPRLLLPKPQDFRPVWQAPVMQEAVAPICATPHPIRVIQRAVCDAYGISLPELLGRQRLARVVRPRQVAIYLSKTLTRNSMPELGRRFGGRDHTTVLHAVRNIERLRQTNPELNRTINTIKGSLDHVGAVDGRQRFC